MWKSNKKIVISILVSINLVACQQLSVDTLTNNNVSYWMRDGHVVIQEYSKKDTLVKFLHEDMTYHDLSQNVMEAVYGRKFKISNDTIFEYINIQGRIIMCDTIHVTSFRRNKLILRTKDGEYFHWHRLSKKEIQQRLEMQNK